MTAMLCMVVRCDRKGCDAQFVCDPGTYKDGWKRAKELGWTYHKDYDENNIGKNFHACPKNHKEGKAVLRGAGVHGEQTRDGEGRKTRARKTSGK